MRLFQQLFFLVLFSLSVIDAQGQIDSSLYQAIVQNDLGGVEEALKMGVDINATDENGANSLMWAVYKGDVKMVKYFKNQGATVPSKGTIPIQNGGYYGNLTGIAAGEGKLEILKFLLDDFKISIDEKEYNAEQDTTNGWTALQWGAALKKVNVVDYLTTQQADTILAYSELSSFYQWQNKLPRAIALVKTAKAEIAKHQGMLSSNYGSAINDLATLYLAIGQYQEAKLLFQEAKHIFVEVFGKQHYSYAVITGNLASVFDKMGEYEKAEALSQESKDMYALVLGKEHPNYALATNNMAFLYQKKGNYQKAEALYLEAKELFAKTYGKEHPNYATSLNNLGFLYENIGSYKKSEQFYQEAITIQAKVLGKEHPDYGYTINNLAYLYKKMGKYEEAASLYQEAKEIFANSFGKENVDYAMSLNNLGELNQKIQNFDKAEELFKEALDITTKVLGKEHSRYGLALNNLGYFYLKMGKFQEAKSLFLEAKDLYAKVWGKEHFDYVYTLNNLAQLYKKMGEYDKAATYLLEFFSLKKNLINQAFNFLSEIEKQKYLNRNFESNRNMLYSFPFNYDQSIQSVKNLQYDLALFSKGIQLNTSQATKSFIFEQADTLTKAGYYDLLNIRRKLVKEYEKPLAQRADVKTLESKQDSLEKILAKASATFREEIALSKATYLDVQKTLGPEEAAIEFVHFNFTNLERTDSILYAAAVLLPDAKQVQYIPLFEEKVLGKTLKNDNERKAAYVEKLYSNMERGNPLRKQINLYDLIWSPLDSLLNGVKTIYYSPSGILHRLNLAAIALDEETIVADKYHLINLSSTRSLAIKPENKAINNTAYIVGGINYEYDSTAIAQVNIEVDSLGAQKGSGSFAYVDRGLRGETWNYLKWTQKESSSITTLLNQEGYEVNNVEGFAATEESFKQLGIHTKSPKVIHLATHGFFFPDPVDSLQIKTNEPIFKLSEHPMLRSGLLFAGANRVWSGAASATSQEDGILTAMEISNSNLSNTELVVLSACETGLGDIQGSEGVYGLQRAFKKAGAKYLIMSLWQVPDRETSVFMTTFYKNWLEDKMTIPAAFNKTQKEMRDRFFNPYQWAGFVLIE